MFEYNLNPKTKELYINLPKTLVFNFDFLNDMTEMVNKSIGEDCTTILITCTQNSNYDKMCKAYLLNVFRSLLILKPAVKWSTELSSQILSTVDRKDGGKFKDIDVEEVISNNNLTYYDFRGDKDVQKPVDEMAKILVSRNLTINSEKVKEFLSTTIGEIFSNSINHSDQEEVFFMFDIQYQENEFYLCVNIIDYGTTIISNVKSYFEKRDIIYNKSTECFEWAIKSGNTTREKSGGYGLPTLISYIENTNGDLFIFSGDSYYRLEEKESKIELSNGFFHGTSVTFRVKLYDTAIAIKYDAKKENLVSVNLDSI